MDGYNYVFYWHQILMKVIITPKVLYTLIPYYQITILYYTILITIPGMYFILITLSIWKIFPDITWWDNALPLGMLNAVHISPSNNIFYSVAMFLKIGPDFFVALSCGEAIRIQCAAESEGGSEWGGNRRFLSHRYRLYLHSLPSSHPECRILALKIKHLWGVMKVWHFWVNRLYGSMNTDNDVT